MASHFFLDFKFVNNQILHLYTDAAASIGFGAVFDTRWFSGLWHEACKSLHITILEFYPILLAINIWGHLLQNKCLLFHSDNIAVVSIINKFSSKDPHVMTLLRTLVLDCLRYNIYIRAEHVPGVLNITSDMLSRSQVHQAKRHNPRLQDNPELIPPRLLLHKLLAV